MTFWCSLGAALIGAVWYLIWSIRPLPADEAFAAARLLFLDVGPLRTRRSSGLDDVAATVRDLRRYAFTAYDLAWRRSLAGPGDNSLALLRLTAIAARFQLHCWTVEAAAWVSFPDEHPPLAMKPLFDAADRLVCRSRSLGLIAIQTA